MQWYKIDKNHRPDVGHAIYITENPCEGGITCHVKEIDDKGFLIVSQDKTYQEFIQFDAIEGKGNLYAWDRNRTDDFPDYDPNEDEDDECA